jgi:hypothetical protein
MGICALAPGEKKVLAEKVGSVLVKKNGKKKNYSPAEVRGAARTANTPVDWDCWAYALYCSPLDFNSYHREIGEVCNYDFMHGKMLAAVLEFMPGVHMAGAASAVSDAVDSSWFSDLLDLFDGADLS